MATIVIVHGGFGGGWEWTEVASLLRERGHAVFTPTLTGMGERAHLGPAGLDTHVRDIVEVLTFEDLREVVLCGASYGGMAVTGAADALADRVAALVYIDALVPRDGQAGLDLLPSSFGDLVLAQSGPWVDVPDAVLPPAGSIPEDERQRFIERLRPQPAASFTEPVRLSGAAENLPRAFVRCTTSNLQVGGDPIEPHAARARAEGWLYRELTAPHDPHLFDPAATAGVLDEICRTLEI